MPRAPRLFPVLASLMASSLAGQEAPVRVALPVPVDLDLRAADPGALLPADGRDPAQVERSRLALEAFCSPVKGAGTIRLRLPSGPSRVALVLAVARTLKAASPEVRLFVAPDGAEPWLDEQAWGAVEGGALLPGELGSDPAAWRDRLAEAMGHFPGRPWWLWLPADPGALAGTLLGDGGRLVVPEGGPTAALAAQLPAGPADLEGGQGDLLLSPHGGAPRRWRFLDGQWQAAPLPKGRTEVAVKGRADYDLGALLAKVRAAQARSRLAATTLQSTVDLTLRLQNPRGEDGELGFTFRVFEKRGEQPELLQQEVRLNGVKAKLHGEVQLPIVEARSSLARPLELALSERYRYRDLGAAGSGRRRMGFEPVDPDPRLYHGECIVEESSGRILEEVRERDGLPGTVRSERLVLTYGEAAPGLWRVIESRSHERWIGANGIVQVQRRFAFRDWKGDDPTFDAAREAARTSDATILRETPEGARYYTKQGDGTRKVEERPKTSGRALAGLVLVDPGLNPSVFPAGGFTYFDFNAFDKGGQFTTLIAGVFDTASLTQPLGAGFDLSANALALLLKVDDRPVKDGKLLDRDAVGRQFGRFSLGLGHDLGAGFRLEGKGHFLYDKYSRPRDDNYETPGFVLPPSGWTRMGEVQLSWLQRGFELRGSQGWGQRPDGVYGAPGALQTIPEAGRFTRWSLGTSYTHEIGTGWWLKGAANLDAGRAFDRFNALEVGGGFGGGSVAGIRSNALSADRIAAAHLVLSLPSAPSLRLSFSLDHAEARAFDDHRTYGFTGLGIAGDLPGFWWFTAARIDMGVGLQSDVPGVRTVNGYVALLRVF